MKKLISFCLCWAMLVGVLGIQSSAADKFTAVFIGGSITLGSGASVPNETSFVALVGKYLTDTLYTGKDVTIVNAGLGGTGSNLGLFRLENDVIAYEPDLVFIEFAVNDTTAAKDEPAKMRNMEAIVRQLLRLSKKPQIVFLYTTTATTNLSIPTEGHQAVADYYEIPSIDLQQAIVHDMSTTSREAADYFTDGVHPNDTGYKVYADYIIDALDKGILQNAVWKDQPISNYETDNPQFVNNQTSKAIYRGNWVEDGDDIYSTTPGDSVEFDFYGSTIGLYSYLTTDGGYAEYSIDYGAVSGQVNMYFPDLVYPKPICDIFVTDLAPGHHNIRITVGNYKAPGSGGNKIRFNAFMVDEGSVYEISKEPEVPSQPEQVEPIFDLGYEGYDAGTREGLNNRIDNDIVVAANNEAEISVVEQKLYGGGDFNYLQCAPSTATYGGNNRGITIDGEEFRNKNELTVETWVNLDMVQKPYSRLFDFSNVKEESGDTHDSAMYVMIEQPYTIYYRPAGHIGSSAPVSKTYNAVSYFGKWSHFVFTRKWNDASSAWTYAVYINGVTIPALSGEATVASRGWDESDYNFCIGAQAFDGGMVFGGGVSEFRIYDKAFSQEQAMYNYQDGLPGHTVLGNGLNLTGGIPTTENVDVNLGEITLNFDNYINASSIKNGIKMTGPDGAAVKGGVYISVSEDNPMDVSIRFGKLAANSEYSIRMDENLKSVNDKSATLEVFTFTTGDGYIVNDDFQSGEYVVDQPAPSGKGIGYKSSNTDNNSANILVKEVSGDKYLSLSANAVKTSTEIYKAFDKPISDNDTIVMEAKVRPTNLGSPSNTATAPRELGRIVGIDEGYTTVGNFTADSVDGVTTASENDIFSEISFDPESRDSNGFYNVQIRIKKDPANGYYYGEMYNLNDETTGPFIKKHSAKKIQAIKRIMVTHIFPWDDSYFGSVDDQINYVRSEISELKIYKLAVDVLHVSKYDPIDQNIKVTLTDDAKPDSVNMQNVQLKKVSDGSIITQQVIYNAEDRSITIETSQPVFGGEDYRVVLRGVTTSNDIPFRESTVFTAKSDISRIGPVVFTNYSGDTVTRMQGVDRLGANFALENLSLGSATCKAILAIFDGTRLIDCVMKDVTLDVDQQKEESIMSNEINVSENYNAKFMIWYKFDEFTPNAQVVELHY